MPVKKPLSVEWSKRAEDDLAQIEHYYLEEAGEQLSEMAGDAIYWQVQRIASIHLKFREGRANTRECAMQGWPYTIVYKIDIAKVRVVRVLHQRREYFNRRK